MPAKREPGVREIVKIGMKEWLCVFGHHANDREVGQCWTGERIFDSSHWFTEGG